MRNINNSDFMSNNIISTEKFIYVFLPHGRDFLESIRFSECIDRGVTNMHAFMCEIISMHLTDTGLSASQEHCWNSCQCIYVN